MNDSRVNFGLARLHSWLFAVGGSTLGENMSILSSVERLEPKFNTWEEVTSLSTGESGCGAKKRGEVKRNQEICM